jgi:hypothetical protein
VRALRPLALVLVSDRGGREGRVRGVTSDIFSRAAWLEARRRASDEYHGLAHRDFLRVPDCFKQIDTSRQVKAVISDATVDDYNYSMQSNGCDAKRYLQLSRAVFYGHNYAIGAVAWCVNLQVSPDAVLAIAQFPPPGAHEMSDFVWSRILSGEVRGALVGSTYSRSTASFADGVMHCADWTLKEWSVCEGEHGANKNAKLIEVAGLEVALHREGAYGAIPTDRKMRRRVRPMRAESIWPWTWQALPR